jgi:hypothetical protein
MRLGRTSTICFLSIGAAYAASFVGCGGDTNDGNGRVGGTNNTTNTTTSTTIVITGAGGNGGTGAGGGTGTGGAGGSGGEVIIDGDAACVAEPRAGEQIPIDLFFMVDKSGSMTCPVPGNGACTGSPNAPPPNRWSSIKDALITFANSSTGAGLGVGMGFFPKLANGNSGSLLCNPTDYSTPAAVIAPLPGSAGAIQTALNAQMPNGSTPTVPALSGAVAYATTYAQSHPGRTTAIVFATDGEPTECANNNNNIMGAAAVARAAANPPAGTPPIRTFVLGVGPSLGNLNQIAMAGNTTAAHLVESGGSAELLNALNEIRKGTLTCDYQIPVVPGKPLNFKLVNIKVRIGPPPAMAQYISKVMDASGCGATQGGWYFDNPDAPTKITLCPATCDPMIKTTGSTLDVVIGCKAIVTPPS